jgi:hypothetical protein
MKLTKDKIKNAVMCAQQVLRQEEVFGGDENKLAISVDAVTDYIAEHCGIEIEIREVVFEATHLKGRKETYKLDGAISVVIEIRSNLSDFWKRFVALKELMHIIVDKDDDDLTPYGDVILEKLVLEGHIGIISGDGDSPPAQSELVAEIAAIEVIYPIGLRRADSDAIEDENSDITPSKVGLKYEAPGPIVSTALNLEYLKFIVNALDLDSN